MNWEAIGALAELIAAIGVIVSLIYLAKQINANSDNIAQNTKALVSDRDVSSNEATMNILGSLAGNAELSALVIKGSLDVLPLDDLERFRYSAFLSRTFESHQTFYVQHIKGSVSEELWEFYSGAMAKHLQMPGIAKWWRRNRHDFNKGFADYIDRKRSDT